MKTHKVVWACLLLFLLQLALASCNYQPHLQPDTYSFRQARTNIERIEICKYDHNTDTRTPLVELPQTDMDSLLDDIASLEMHQFFPLDPILSYGDIVIAISYLDGESEIIGITNIGWSTVGGKLHTTNNRFAIKDICAVISKYVDAEVLADSSEYFTKPVNSSIRCRR